MRSLGSYRTLLRKITRTTEASLPKEEANELLNAGWVWVAEDTECLASLLHGNIVNGQSVCTIPRGDNVIIVQQVKLQRDGTTIVTLYPEAAKPLQCDPAEEEAGTPGHVSYELAKHRDPTDLPADLELRFSPPPDWDETDGCWIYCIVKPDRVKDDDDQITEFHMECMGMAGLYYAAFLVTGLTSFWGQDQSLYEKSLRPYYKSGIATKSGLKRAPGTGPRDIRSGLFDRPPRP